MRRGRTLTIASTTALAMALAAAAPAAASTGAHLPLVQAGIIGSIFSTLGHAVLGAFSWTIGLASKFILTTIGALVRMLIPRSWATEGVQIMEWIVAVPNYAGTVTSPTGHAIYGFGGINALRDLFTWIGVGLLPLTLLYGTTRAMLGEGGHVAVPLARVLGIAALLVSYPYWWTEAAALTDTLTHTILTLHQVASGLHQLMLYAVDGVALGGWQLVDLALMAVVAIELLALIFLKVSIILLGALLYATGPITIGLVATDAGAAVARAWASAAVMLVALPVVWATLFAVGALLVGDAGTAGPLIGGHTAIGTLLGGVLLAIAGAASLWMCLRAAREAMGLLRLQLGGLLALGHRSSGATPRTAASQSTTVQSLRKFGSRVAQAAGAAAGELGSAGMVGAAAVRGGRAAASLGRHGVIGTAIAGGRSGVSLAAPRAIALVGRSRAGAVAVRMAKAGTAGWYAAASEQRHSAPERHGAQPTAGQRGTGARTGPDPSRSPQPRRSAATAAPPKRTPPAQPVPPTRPGATRDPGHTVRAQPRRDRPPRAPTSSTPVRGGNRPGRGKR